MLYQKFYVHSTLSIVLFWTVPGFAQDFTDFWCALATASNNKCFVFNPDGSPASGLGTGVAGNLDEAMENAFETITPLTNYSVTVSTTHGKISSSPAGINCGSQCAAYFVDKSTVTLNAVPDPGYQFKNWQGACASETTSSASLNIAGNVSCSAVFELAPKNYTVQVSATHGKITSSPAQIDCGSQCSGEFAEGSTVQLTAIPDTGYQFVTWQGACSGNSTTASLTVSQNQSCSAVFELISSTPDSTPAKNYTVQVSATHGKITSSPAKIDCGNQCAGEFTEGSTVKLTAIPDTGYQFVTWQGACSGNSTTASLTVSQDQSCSAVFELISSTPDSTPAKNYTVQVSATHGKITSSPAGIDCGSQCSGEFAEGSTVQLTAIPDTGYQFVTWQGACSGNSTTASLTVSQNQSCSAVFELISSTPEPTPAKNYTVQVSATHGKITSSPAKIDCGNQCAGEFTEGSTVQLTAIPDTGYQFVTWQGACSGNSTTASLTVSQNQSCSAVFELISSTPEPTPAKNYTVQVSATHGKITSSPAGIDCGSQCAGEFAEGSTVQLTATPDTGYQFVTWQGACSGNSTTASLTVSQDQSCSAVFELIHIVEKPAVSVCAPTQPLQSVEKTVELTVGEETIVKVLGGQGRSIVKMPAAQFASVSGIEGIGESEFRIKVLPRQVGQTLLTVADCTKNEVTISLIIKPQPAKQCEVHQPIVAEQSELILMQGEGEKTVYFTGGLDDGKIQREISQFPNPAVARVSGFNRPLNNDFAVTLAPIQTGETYLKVRDCSGEASVRVIVEKSNALAIDLTGKFISTKTYFKSTLQPDNSVQTYVYLDPKDQGNTLEFIYILEKRGQGAPTFFTWNSQKWQLWDGRSLTNLAVGAIYSDGLATFTTAPVKLLDGEFDKLHIGYRVADAIVFHSIKLE